jgi:cytochrome c biogenesis protein CcdA
VNHLPFIAASYALGVAVPVGFAIAAFFRLGAARRRLAAIDPRQKTRSGREARS